MEDWEAAFEAKSERRRRRSHRRRLIRRGLLIAMVAAVIGLALWGVEWLLLHFGLL